MGGWGGSSIKPFKNKKYPLNGFSALTRKRHFDDHGKEYGVNSINEYEKLAIVLRDKNIDTNIREFISESGLRFKYDIKNNDFLIYKENGEIVTLYKPDDGYNYWERQVVKYGSKE
ncbi:MAG: hypothetical protein LBC58_01015 [Clostridiales Family XIII bacterium]|jgi:pyocin large subunit-like protein|nr:hypothetical protein [Clostridiales Family XIII bacterium]